MRERCSNPRCGDFLLQRADWLPFCPSCRWMARRAFGLGCFVAGVVLTIWQALR